MIRTRPQIYQIRVSRGELQSKMISTCNGTDRARIETKASRPCPPHIAHLLTCSLAAQGTFIGHLLSASYSACEDKWGTWTVKSRNCWVRKIWFESTLLTIWISASYCTSLRLFPLLQNRNNSYAIRLVLILSKMMHIKFFTKCLDYSVLLMLTSSP